MKYFPEFKTKYLFTVDDKETEQKLDQISLLDRAYRAATNNELFFNHGCGDSDYLAELEEIYNTMPPIKPIELKWEASKKLLGVELANGTFISPAHKFLPSESKIAYVRKIMPENANAETPIVIHFPGTGDEGFRRREFFLAVPLAKKGIGSIILEAPFYGSRGNIIKMGCTSEKLVTYLKWFIVCLKREDRS